MLGSALSNRKDRTIKLLAPKAPSLVATSAAHLVARAGLLSYNGMAESTSEECALCVGVGAEQQEGPDHHAARA